MKETKASVSVFFALIFVLVLSMIFSLLESVRVRLANAYYEAAFHSSLLSSQGEYCRELFERYDIFGYWPDEDGLEKQTEDYFSYYANSEKDLFLSGIDWFSMKEYEIGINSVEYLGDYGAYPIRRQMAEDAQLSGAASLLEKLTEQKEMVEKGEEFSAQLEKAGKDLQETDWYELSPERIEAEEEVLEEERENWQEKMRLSMDESLIDQLREWITNPLLSLVLPNHTSISNRTVQREALATGITYQEAKDTDWGMTAEHALTCCYIQQHTGNFLSPSKGDGLSYQTEYILAGKESDTDNLSGTVSRLVLLREAMNLLFFLQEMELMEQALAAAELLVGWTLIPGLVEAVKYVLISVWTMAESILDVRCLLQGESVPFVKKGEDWLLTMERIPLLISGEQLQREGKSGMDYESCIGLLLFLSDHNTIVDRMCGLIQYDLCLLYPPFRIDSCIASASLTLSGKIEKGFLLAPYQSISDRIHSIRKEAMFSYEGR